MKKPKRRRRHEPLIHHHLEHVSRRLLEEHSDIVRGVIGRNGGVYALYRKNRLYYIGLATGLRSRLKGHLKNRHGNAWDSFSIYLTIRAQHIKEIESLLLRVATPPGNRVTGRPTGSSDMLPILRRSIRLKHDHALAELIGKPGSKTEKLGKGAVAGADPLLMRLFPRGARIRGRNKGRVFRARIRPTGQVRFAGKTYASVSMAAVAALKRQANGWRFWEVERVRGTWVRLYTIRDAETPL